MKTKIKEVHDYFKQKLIRGDYEIIEIKERTVLITIDGYKFSLWVANEDFSFETYSGDFNFMAITLDKEEVIKGWSVIKKHLDKHYQEVTLQNKKIQFEQLKKELSL